MKLKVTSKQSLYKATTNINVLLTVDESRKLTMFFSVLIEVDKQVASTKKAKKKKSKDKTKIPSILAGPCNRHCCLSAIAPEERRLDGPHLDITDLYLFVADLSLVSAVA